MKKADNSFHERRKCQRIKKAVPISFKSLAEQRKKIRSFCLDISGNGISITTDFRAKKGDVFKIEILLPNDPQPIGVKSTVVRCEALQIAPKEKKKYLVGLKYVNIVKKDRERFIFNFCELLINTCL